MPGEPYIPDKEIRLAHPPVLLLGYKTKKTHYYMRTLEDKGYR